MCMNRLSIIRLCLSLVMALVNFNFLYAQNKTVTVNLDQIYSTKKNCQDKFLEINERFIKYVKLTSVR